MFTGYCTPILLTWSYNIISKLIMVTFTFFIQRILILTKKRILLRIASTPDIPVGTMGVADGGMRSIH